MNGFFLKCKSTSFFLLEQTKRKGDGKLRLLGMVSSSARLPLGCCRLFWKANFMVEETCLPHRRWKVKHEFMGPGAPLRT